MRWKDLYRCIFDENRARLMCMNGTNDGNEGFAAKSDSTINMKDSALADILSPRHHRVRIKRARALLRGLLIGRSRGYNLMQCRLIPLLKPALIYAWRVAACKNAGKRQRRRHIRNIVRF